MAVVVMKRPSRLFFLLVVSTAPCGVRALLNPQYYYNVSAGACIENNNPPTAYTQFGPWRGPPPPVTVDAASGSLNVSYPAYLSLSYGSEGVRSNLSQCSFCPYNEPPEAPAPPEYLMRGGVRYMPYAMYGPCFNGAASGSMGCVQNLALFPPDFCGEYFFPTQDLNPALQTPYGDWSPWYYHGMLEGDNGPTDISNVDPRTQRAVLPTNYALGKGAVQASLATFVVVHNATGVKNATLSALVQAPYASPPGAPEGWLRWAQHFCRPTCHRDSLVQIATVRPADYAGQPLRSYLSRLGPSGEPLAVTRCIKCPPLQAAYQWGAYDYTYDPIQKQWLSVWDTSIVGDPRAQYVQGDCFPWFGSIPLVTVTYVNGATAPAVKFYNFSKVYHSATTDGITAPDSNYVYSGVACPPNTYNDVCAHYFKFAGIAQPACKPCPPGFHTAGRSGPRAAR